MLNNLRVFALALAFGFALAALYYGANHVSGHLGQRAALDYTDGQLPENLAAIATAPNSGTILEQYRVFLRTDNYLVPLILLAFVCVAWSASLGSPGSRSPRSLAAAALLYALSDWGENWILLNAAADLMAGEQPAWLGVAAAAQWTKWIFFTIGAVLVPLALLRSLGSPRAWGTSLFLDVPALVDDLWRRLEFHFHKERNYNVEKATLEPRPWYRKTSLWLFGLTVLFVAYGPTLDGLCSAGPQVMEVLVWLPLALLVWLALRAFKNMWTAIRVRIDLRFEWLGREPGGPFLDERRSITRSFLAFATVLLVAPMVAVAIMLGTGVLRRGWCVAPKQSDYFGLLRNWLEASEYLVQFSEYSLARFALFAIAVIAFAYLCTRLTAVRHQLWLQGALVAAVAIGTWLLSPAGANEASHQPYVHLFLIVAPAVCMLLCVAPRIAARRLKKLRAGSVPASARFTALLAKQELFVPSPDDPELSGSRVMHAVTHGFSDRLFQLLIPPALLTLMAPADWLWTTTVSGLVLAFLISTWGNMSTRWQHMVLDVQRWFLRGTAFFVSLFVMALAIARLAGIDYVTTILNAAPLGVVFGMVLMSYVLSWLVEYWINRVVAVELLGMLGAGRDDTTLPYKLSAQWTPVKKVDVEPTDRHLMVHSIGRFAVVGWVFDKDRNQRRVAFHSYDLLELFRALPRREADDDIQHEKDLDHVSDSARRTHLYFHSFNAVLILLAVACWLGYKGGPRYTDPTPLVQAREHVSTAKYFDLAERLLATDENNRPALILAASGGGTRAALHTAHVLQGLHRLGAARDIVLMSGVSGGGVALAYFAANRDTLVGPSATDESWDQFRKRIAQPFIEDVLEGATELRVYRADSVSMLLAESFKRRLAAHGGRWTLDVPEAGLLLNTAITGHPDAESDVLATTLDDSRKGRGGDCKERDRPYNLMGGGRLVFTNLGQTATFPQRDNRIPDVRLPYVLVRDPALDLEKAAALNANFPPAFPNARVLLRGAPGAVCPDRSFFVTDGGAQENLGLVSALYAVHSALDEIRRACSADSAKTHSWCKRKLRPIRFVIAEASAATFDYEEDRGIGAAFSAKERLTGGLTEELVGRIRAQYLFGAVPAAAQNLEFDFLALPLAFRARGGLGTHWMHAAHVQMTDPRARKVPSWYEFRERARAEATISKDQLDSIWYALHDPVKNYCGKPGGNTEKDLRDFYRTGDRDTDTVRRWICGAHGDKHAPRDHHVVGWKKLRDAVRDPKRTL